MGGWVGGVALILFFGGIRHLHVDADGLIFFMFFSEVFGYALLIHFSRPGSSLSGSLLPRLESPVNDFGIDFEDILGPKNRYFFHILFWMVFSSFLHYCWITF